MPGDTVSVPWTFATIQPQIGSSVVLELDRIDASGREFLKPLQAVSYWSCCFAPRALKLCHPILRREHQLYLKFGLRHSVGALDDQAIPLTGIAYA